MSENKLSMQHQNVVGALQNPNGILRYAIIPNGQVNVVLFLDLQGNWDLIVPEIPIQEIIVFVPSKSFQYLINEWKRKVVFTRDGIQFATINANSNFCEKSDLH